MKLSEAIRLGSVIRPQGFGGGLRDGGTCAFGAALEAIGETVGQRTGQVAFVRGWEHLFKVALKPPCCPTRAESNLFSIVIHLNDYHRWTREHIADWVATIEDSLEPKPETTEVLTVAD